MLVKIKYANIINIAAKEEIIPELLQSNCNSKKIFECLISSVTLFNGNIPSFMLRDITHEEWIKTKNETWVG